MAQHKQPEISGVPGATFQMHRSLRIGAILPMLAALLCVIVALLRPEWPMQRTVYQYTFVFDITQSMNTRDVKLDGVSTDRLTLSKQAVRQALEKLPCGSSVGLGLYTANNTYQLFTPLEICGHYTTINDVLQHINWQMAWANDSKIQYGLFAALELLNESHDDPPQLVFISDGDQSPKSDRQPAFMSEPGVPGGYIIGVGDETASPVPHLAADNSITGYWTREEALGEESTGSSTSQLYLSGLDEANLKRLAQTTGMQYARLQQAGQLNDLLQVEKFGTKRVVETDLRVFFAGLCLFFVLLSGLRLKNPFSSGRRKTQYL